MDDKQQLTYIKNMFNIICHIYPVISDTRLKKLQILSHDLGIEFHNCTLGYNEHNISLDCDSTEKN